MTIYWIIIIISLLLMIIRYDNYRSGIYVRYVIAFIVLMILFSVYVFRSVLVGKDYLQYYTWYSLYTLSGLRNNNTELGYAYISSFARYIHCFKIIPIVTFLIVILAIFCVKKCMGHINGFTLLGLFILLGLYTMMFNPIRESIAFAFLSFGISFLLICYKNDYATFIYHSFIICLVYLFFVFLAYGFHKTAVFGVVFLIFPFVKYKYTKKEIIVIGLLMVYLSFTGIMNKLFTGFISLDHDYTLKYQHTSLNTNLLFMQTLIKIGPLIVQLIFLYIFISKYRNFVNGKLNFILWGYLFYLFMFTAPGSNIARRLQVYTFIFPLIYSCVFLDGIVFKNKKVDKMSNILKFSFISFWVLFYISKLYINASGIVPYFL